MWTSNDSSLSIPLRSPHYNRWLYVLRNVHRASWHSKQVYQLLLLYSIPILHLTIDEASGLVHSCILSSTVRAKTSSYVHLHPGLLSVLPVRWKRLICRYEAIRMLHGHGISSPLHARDAWEAMDDKAECLDCLDPKRQHLRLRFWEC